MKRVYQPPPKTCTKEERGDFWFKVVADQKNSGMGSVKFSRLHGLKHSTFKNYLHAARKIKYQHGADKSDPLKAVDKAESVTKFIPLQIVTDVANKASINTVVQEIKFIFKNDHELILSPSIPEVCLLSIIKMVAGLEC